MTPSADTREVDQEKADMQDPFSIRGGTEADARGIAAVLVDGWETTYRDILPQEFLATFHRGAETNTRNLLRSLPDSAAVFVADDRHAIVGVALVRGASDTADEYGAEVDALYVIARSQQQGVGARLFRRIVAWSDEQGITSLRLWVFKDNPFRKFYDRFGGHLLAGDRSDDFGGSSVVSVSYGWRDLPALADLLDDAIRSTSHRHGAYEPT